MINFLHTYLPSRVLISFGTANIYWYGFFIVVGILLAIMIAMKLAGYYNVSKDTVIDIAFWLILSGVIGARIYDVLLDFNYYRLYPLDAFKIWQGGLAIHGAIIGGAIALFIYIRKYKLDFWTLASIIAPGLGIGQAIGRWGNYFNQELFGRPTGLPWGIPIAPVNRLMDYYNFQYFHPVFLYESIGSFAIFLILAYLHYRQIKKGRVDHIFILVTYLALYSFLRFSLEFLRIDPTPVIFGFRWPQLLSAVIIVMSLAYYYKKLKNSLRLEKIQ